MTPLSRAWKRNSRGEDMSQEMNARKQGVLTIKTVIEPCDARQKDTGNNRIHLVLWVVSAIIIAQLLSLIPAVIDTLGSLFR